MPALVARAREGDPRAVARLISLVENGDASAARGRRGARAVHRPGPGHRPDRLARRGQVDHHQRAGPGAARGRATGSGCSPSTRPARSPAARSSATGSGCRTTPPTPASTSGRCPAAATSAGWPRPPRRRSGCSRAPAATSCWSRPSASARPRWRSPRSPTPRWCCSRPGMGDAIQAVKAGILEIADVFVVNKADRDGADATYRDIQGMIALGERGPGRVAAAGGAGGRRPGEGIDDVVAAIAKHRAWLDRARRAAAPPGAPGRRRGRGDRAGHAARQAGLGTARRRSAHAGRRGRRRPDSTRTPPPPSWSPRWRRPPDRSRSLAGTVAPSRRSWCRAASLAALRSQETRLLDRGVGSWLPWTWQWPARSWRSRASPWRTAVPRSCGTCPLRSLPGSCSR